MGIPKFYGRWIRSGKYRGLIVRQLPPKIDNLWIDGNGSLHYGAQIHYGYGNGFNARVAAAATAADPLQYEYEFDRKFGEQLMDLLSKVSPKIGFTLTFDGVAPIGKIEQQRERRNKAVLPLKGEPKVGFDSNCITPGTAFMVRLDKYIQQWLLMNRDQLPPNLIYSSHMVRGEGEHNIFKHVRQKDIKFSDGANVVYGLDADLIILSLLSDAPRILLCREDLSNNVDIDTLRHSIIDDLREGLGKSIDGKTLIRDFAFLTFFVGNDFVRPIFAFGDVADTINSMMETYKALKTPITNSDCTIDWNVVWAFISSFANVEEQLIQVMASTDVKYPSKVLMDATTIKMEEASTSNTESYPEEDVSRQVDVDYDKFRKGWYRQALGPKDEAVWQLLDDLNINPASEKAIEKMCLAYLKTLQWNLLYYVQGEEGIKKDWVYEYRYAPLLKDLAATCLKLVETDSNISQLLAEELGPHDDDIQYTFNEQLTSVIPASSLQLIPERLRFLVAQGGPLCDMCPINFPLDYQHKDMEWESIAILPFIPVKRVYDAVKSVLMDADDPTGGFSVLPAKPYIINDISKDIKFSIKPSLGSLRRPYDQNEKRPYNRDNQERRPYNKDNQERRPYNKDNQERRPYNKDNQERRPYNKDVHPQPIIPPSIHNIVSKKIQVNDFTPVPIDSTQTTAGLMSLNVGIIKNVNNLKNRTLNPIYVDKVYVPNSENVIKPVLLGQKSAETEGIRQQKYKTVYKPKIVQHKHPFSIMKTDLNSVDLM
jgi:5'-3' exoribonuclease 1